MNPKVLVGIFLGAMATFVFCAMTMKAVGRAAKGMVEEVRRQFREKPGIMEGDGAARLRTARRDQHEGGSTGDDLAVAARPAHADRCGSCCSGLAACWVCWSER